MELEVFHSYNGKGPMSLQANRFTVFEKRERRMARLERIALRRESRNQLPNISKANLQDIFKSTSLERVLQICSRLKRMKKRYPGFCGQDHFQKKPREGRNYHHLTPQCRRKVSFHGGGFRNLLLIKKDRHIVWHNTFDVMTLEEIIFSLEHRLQIRHRIRSSETRRQCRPALRAA